MNFYKIKNKATNKYYLGYDCKWSNRKNAGKAYKSKSDVVNAVKLMKELHQDIKNIEIEEFECVLKNVFPAFDLL